MSIDRHWPPHRCPRRWLPRSPSQESTRDEPFAASSWCGRRGGLSASLPFPHYSRSNRADCSVTDIRITPFVDKIPHILSRFGPRVHLYNCATTAGDTHGRPTSLPWRATLGEDVRNRGWRLGTAARHPDSHGRRPQHTLRRRPRSPPKAGEWPPMTMAPGPRKFALTAHIISSVGLLGAIAGFLALAVAGLTSPNDQMVRAAYLAMEFIGRFVIVPLAFAS